VILANVVRSYRRRSSDGEILYFAVNALVGAIGRFADGGDLASMVGISTQEDCPDEVSVKHDLPRKRLLVVHHS
jgi:hypothetical protein